MRVGYAGERGAFGEQAARAVRSDAEPWAYPSFEEVAEAVVRGEVEAGVIPIENGIAGAVVPGISALLRVRPPVCGEVRVRVRHLLLAPAGRRLEELAEVHSHPQALAQCRRFLEARGLRAIPEVNTATAARFVAEGRWPNAAAIASRAAAERLGLEVLAEEIADAAENVTRFYVLGRMPPTAASRIQVLARTGPSEELPPGARRIGACPEGELFELEPGPQGPSGDERPQQVSGVWHPLSPAWIRLGELSRALVTSQEASASTSS